MIWLTRYDNLRPIGVDELARPPAVGKLFIIKDKKIDQLHFNKTYMIFLNVLSQSAIAFKAFTCKM